MQASEKQPRTTTIRIEKTDFEAHNVESNVFWKTRLTLIGRNRSAHSNIYQFDDLSQTSHVKLEIVSDNKVEAVELPNFILHNLERYFQENPQTKAKGYKFDCVAFSHWLYGVPYAGKIDFDKWLIAHTDDEEDIAVGDMLGMGVSDGDQIKLKHFAIYIGRGLYISKFGGLGKLIFATVPEMKIGFDCTDLFLFKPRTLGNLFPQIQE